MSAFDGWNSPPTPLTLPLGDVHVWRASLDRSPRHLQQLAQTLSSEEAHRAERFHFEQHRQRFIVGRGLLRIILGNYLGLEPAQVEFCYSSRGKPALADISGQTLQFNLSHSHGLVLYAFTRNREIGIDVEQIRVMPEAERLAERFFSERESAALRDLPPDQKTEAFFNCWTRKEAYLKAIGDGLVSLDRCEVSLIPGEPARLVSIEGDSLLASRWSVRELSPAPGYAAAIAVAGHGWQLKKYDIEPVLFV